jgi:hypothetical protein
MLAQPDETEPTVDQIDAKSPIGANSATATTAPIDGPKTPSIVLPLQGNRERAKARFRLLRRLPANHDNEGAAAPSHESVDRAIAFIDQMRKFPAFFPTLADDGAAVIEFEERDRGFFADITFVPNGRIECYRRETGKVSEYFEGNADAAEAREFLESYLGVLL